MIRRTSDFSLFSDKELSKIASAIQKAESKKLFDTFDNIENARIAKKELRVMGYDAEVYTVGNKHEVYMIMPEKISLREAENSGSFKKLAWGRYVFEKEASLEMHNYSFDDGSIWRVSNDEDGTPVLIKEVGEDEEEIIRGNGSNNLSKAASIEKKAGFDTINQNNYQNALKLLFTINTVHPLGDQFFASLFDGLFKMDIIAEMDRLLEEHIYNFVAGMNDPNGIDWSELMTSISSGITNNQFITIQDIEKFVTSYLTGEQAEDESEEQTNF